MKIKFRAGVGAVDDHNPVQCKNCKGIMFPKNLQKEYGEGAYFYYNNGILSCASHECPECEGIGILVSILGIPTLLRVEELLLL